jgi:hypothetical protein
MYHFDKNVHCIVFKLVLPSMLKMMLSLTSPLILRNCKKYTFLYVNWIKCIHTYNLLFAYSDRRHDERRVLQGGLHVLWHWRHPLLRHQSKWDYTALM